jgi:hypothetical protein
LCDRDLTSAELLQVKDAGILRSTVRNFSGYAFALGKIMNKVGEVMSRTINAENSNSDEDKKN